MNAIPFKTLLASLLLAMATPAGAQTLLRVGDPLPPVTIADQHDQRPGIPDDTRQILFAADNTGAGLVTRMLDARDANWLKQTHRVYLADIHKMPGLIARLVALPQLRDKPYSILLGREEADLILFPRKKDCVSVMNVRKMKIDDISFACSDEALREAAGY